MPNVAEILKSAWKDGVDIKEQTPKVSFEFFPPKTPKGIESLYRCAYKMSKQKGLFLDLTWGAGGSTSDLTMEMSTNFKKALGLEVNMHLTCTNITEESVAQALVDAKANGITSIVALRGDPPVGQEKWEASASGFNCALDLVKFIRKEHGDYFSISVAGYPEGHPNAITDVADESKLSPSERSRLINVQEGPEEEGKTKPMVCTDADFEKEIAYLKQKVDAGADVIITQLFYDTAVFFDFIKACRAAGIAVPILPGLMPLGSYGGFRRMTGFCKTRVPAHMEAALKGVKDDADAFKAYGVELLTAMAKEIWASGEVLALHFYCLNQSGTVFKIMQGLGMKVNPLDTDADKADMAAKMEYIKGLAGPEAKKAKTTA